MYGQSVWRWQEVRRVESCWEEWTQGGQGWKASRRVGKSRDEVKRVELRGGDAQWRRIQRTGFRLRTKSPKNKTQQDLKKSSPDMDQNISFHESDRRRRSQTSTATQALTWTKSSISMSLTSGEGARDQESARLEKFKAWHGPGQMFSWVRPEKKTPKIKNHQRVERGWRKMTANAENRIQI